MPRPGKELAGGRFSAGASNQISLMKWIYGIQPDEPEATASMPMLPKTALPGGFALVIGHFISEITDCTQQQKTGPLPVPFPAAAFPFAPVGCPSTMAFIKIDFCGFLHFSFSLQFPYDRVFRIPLIAPLDHHVQHRAKTCLAIYFCLGFVNQYSRLLFLQVFQRIIFKPVHVPRKNIAIPIRGISLFI